ncbi:Protein O-mannosyltransferase 2, partial [Massospora cicadina]
TGTSARTAQRDTTIPELWRTWKSYANAARQSQNGSTEVFGSKDVLFAEACDGGLVAGKGSFVTRRLFAACEASQSSVKYLVPALLTALALYTRLYKIGKSNKVVWDEAHFGKREFYHDVHPPLGKMLVGLSGYLAGNNATFPFESGNEYPPDVNYKFQRTFLSMFGVSLIPLSYFTALNLGMSRLAALLAGSLVLFDNALCVISRFILLDSMLLAFTALAFFFLTGFHRQSGRPFSTQWWVYLAGTGVSLGLASSLDRSPIYMGSFYLHFSILTHSGPGDSTMPSLFQSRLVGTSIGRGPVEVAFGSKVTIKSYTFGGGLLHSHPSLYPAGSNQHQITIYHHSDANNDWVVLRDHDTTAARQTKTTQDHTGEFSTPDNDYMDVDEDPELPVRLLAHGDLIRLNHMRTGANLHSHPIKAPISDGDFEVSGYLNRTLGDAYDHWVLEIYDDLADDNQGKVRILSTRFRLRHNSLGCYLIPSGTRLPEWGFGQGEVVCRSKSSIAPGDALWNFENHNNARLPLTREKAFSHSPFFRDFVHLNVAMWNSNNALTPDPDHYDALASQPYHWPPMLKGIRMCGWDDATIKFYMLGNPLVWWLSTACLFVIVACACVYALRVKRNSRVGCLPSQYLEGWSSFWHAAKLVLVGYCLQYMPYFIMGRVMYLHHYFPALYFSTFAPALVFDYLTRHSAGRARWILFTTTVVAVTMTFIYFSPITYGADYPASALQSRNWLPTWKISGF